MNEMTKQELTKDLFAGYLAAKRHQTRAMGSLWARTRTAREAAFAAAWDAADMHGIAHRAPQVAARAYRAAPVPLYAPWHRIDTWRGRAADAVECLTAALVAAATTTATIYLLTLIPPFGRIRDVLLDAPGPGADFMKAVVTAGIIPLTIGLGVTAGTTLWVHRTVTSGQRARDAQDAISGAQLAIWTRDLIGTTPYWTWSQYRMLTFPVAAILGPVHPGDPRQHR